MESKENKYLYTLLQKYNVKMCDSENDTYTIIQKCLEDTQSEEPFYIIDLGQVVKAYDKWVRLLPDIHPYYAVKCNPNVVLIETLSSLGANFDCASESEIKTVIEITKDPSRILFANPCKMTSHIQYACSNKVYNMTFDCEEELYKIKLYHPYANLILRLAVDDSHSVCKFNKKFGCFLSEVKQLLVIAKRLRLNVIGFSFHVGSNCSCSDSFYTAMEDCRKATDIAKKLGINIHLIDIGGGFPGIDEKVRFEDIAKRVNEGIAHFFGKELSTKTIRFIAEPGRYFAQKSHTLVLNIIGKKRRKNEDGEPLNIYYLNDGIYHSFNCIVFDNYQPVIIPFNKGNGKMVSSCLFGPTCDSLDLIQEKIMLPELSIGEWVYVENFGAYTLSASSEFNGFKTKIFKYIFKT